MDEGKMKKILWVEYQRLFRNKKLFLSSGVSLGIVLMQIIMESLPYVNAEFGAYPLSVFEKWIGGEKSSVFPMLYFLLIPILMAVPYGGTMLEDFKSGYIKNVYTRTGKKEYLTAKYIVAFTSGIFAVIPLIINFALTAMVLPAVIPQASAGFYTISARSMLGELFYLHPYSYLFIYFLLDTVFFGLLATLSITAAFLCEYIYAAVLAPFMVCIVLYGITIISDFNKISPIGFLAPSQSPEADFTVIMAEGILLLLFVLGGIYAGTKKEIF